MSLPPLVEPADELTIDEVRRYSRHLIIPEVGMAGQKRLKNSKVLVIGAGGLGSPALLYLAAAGADDQHLGVLQPLLSGHPDLGDDQVTRIPAHLVDGQLVGWFDQRWQ